MELQTLSVEDVLQIHEYLVQDFARSPDPITPPGVSSVALLESAVGRQWTGSRERLKYPNAVDNAATLAYGICCDHAFHNGNKRTALVAMLAHLDRNKMSLFEVRQNDLYNMILRVAQHTLGIRKPRRRRWRRQRATPDREVAAISDWIKKRSDRLTRGEKPITYKQLRRILQSFGYHLVHPKHNSISVVRYERVPAGLLRRESTREIHINTIGYPGENRTVPLRILKFVRKVCKLREEDGVDSSSFYDNTVVIDAFINRYRTVLRKLAKK